jgi:hypothetical protein
MVFIFNDIPLSKMDIRAALLEEHSRIQAEHIANFIGNDKQRFADLMALFFNNEYRICQRAAWSVSIVAEKYPELIAPYLEPMLLNLENPVHDAVKRNTVRILKDIDPLPENLLGIAATHCFNLLATPSVAVAIKVFAMHILYKICLKEPDLKNELKLLIEDLMPHESKAFLSAGKHTLKKLENLK